MRHLRWITRALPAFCVLLVFACTIEPGPESPDPPSISLDREEPVFEVKVNEPLRIAPTVTNAGESPAYRWTLDGEVVSDEAAFTFVGVETGSFYLIFEVITDHGTASAEMRIDVKPQKFPTITMIVPPDGYSILEGTTISFTPEVDNAEETRFAWTVNETVVSAEKDYTFDFATVGEYAVSFITENEDGSDRLDFTVRVCTAEQMGFEWSFERMEFNVSLGRTLFIRPYAVENAFDAAYSWTVDGEAVIPPVVNTSYAGAAPACLFAFTPETQGAHTVEVTMRNSYTQATAVFRVNVWPSEGAYRRSGGGSAAWNKVYEFTAAPGQFVNEGYTAATPQEACDYAHGRMLQPGYVSLGAFGGCLVVGFDHSIDNDGGYNIRVDGNAFENASEPGIVWVMQDENGNGLPDDTWYELKGSEYGDPGSRLDYAVTYYRPESPGRPVQWTDNDGGNGQVDYLTFHTQPYYYPAWVEADSYTLVGRKLKSRTVEVAASYWQNRDFEWGYADNFSAIDRLTTDGNVSAGVSANHFKIDNAVTYDGRPANLDYIDFVKIQTGVQAKAGWLGENSTEVFGVYDYNLLK